MPADFLCTDEFRFIVINDPHYENEQCGAYLTAAFEQMKRGPEFDFMLTCGDLATAGRAEELAGYKTATQVLGRPSYVVMGNHDWLTDSDRGPWIETFGEQTINYRFDHKGWTFLALDSTMGTEWERVRMQPEAMAWLEAALADIPRTRPLVCFTHTPMGEGVELRLVDAETVLARFSGHNLRHFFCGHFHGNTERKIGATTFTTCACLSHSRGNHDDTTKKGYLLCTAQDGEIACEFVPFVPGD